MSAYLVQNTAAALKESCLRFAALPEHHPNKAGEQAKIREQLNKIREQLHDLEMVYLTGGDVPKRLVVLEFPSDEDIGRIVPVDTQKGG